MLLSGRFSAFLSIVESTLIHKATFYIDKRQLSSESIRFSVVLRVELSAKDRFPDSLY